MEKDPLVGRQIGAYLIQSKIGEGGMAQVYKAYHSRLQRDVAIKVILSQIADQAGFQSRFEREAQLIAKLEHHNIVAVYDFGEIGNLTYLVMQYVGGGTLSDQLRDGQTLAPLQATHYALQMARALHHAHLRGIVHRDVKPQNMLVSATNPNQLLLSDFGIAKLYNRNLDTILTNASAIRPSPENDSTLTKVDQIVGTAQYMAPEQVQGKQVDARTDIYALGIVLFQMLTGQLPFYSTTAQGLLFQHLYVAPASVSAVNPAIPEILAQITAKAMAKAPQDRFQSAEAMAQALEAAISTATHRSSTPLPDDHIAFDYIPNHASLSHPTQDHLTSSSLSHHKQQFISDFPPSTSITEESAHNLTPTTSIRTINSDIRALLAGHSGGIFRASSIGTTLVILLGIILVLFRQALLPWSASTPLTTTSSITTPFTENFRNNERNWTIGNQGNLTATISNSRYILDISNASQTFFPHPTIGALPNNFTLTATILQTTGNLGAFYGLAFRQKDDGNGGNVTCYALAINGNGDYQVLKYDPHVVQGLSILWSTNQPWMPINKGLNQLNTLRTIVRGSKFSFEINNQLVPVNNPTDQTITDSAYTGGQPALLITGPDTRFEVISVQLSIP